MLWQTDKEMLMLLFCLVQVWEEDVQLVIPLGLQTVHSIVCKDLIKLRVLRPAVNELMKISYDLGGGGLQTSQFLFFNGNLVNNWLLCGDWDGDWDGGGEDCLNICDIKVISTQDRLITQPWAQRVKSWLDDKPDLRLCEVSAVCMAPCSCRRGS